MDDSEPTAINYGRKRSTPFTDCVPIIFAWLLFSCCQISLAHAQHCAIEAGSPSCGFNQDVGSNAQTHVPDHHVGNPIDVISGNKYQLDVDYQAIGSALSLNRHYNTALTDHDNRLGYGWRHSYQVVLSQINDRQYQIVQSDGRRIIFTRSSKQPDDGLYVAQHASDGELIQSDLFVWALPDGRRLTFHGSFLIRIDFAHNNYLELFYENRKLRSVTDQYERRLVFEYTAGNIGLQRYDTFKDQPIAGHLQSVKLPNGQQIHYGYDNKNNLTIARFPEGSLLQYGYTATEFPHHLTQRQYIDSRLIQAQQTKTWEYDESGRANQYRSNISTTDLDIVYRDESSNAYSGSVDIRYTNTGIIKHYRWKLDANDETRKITSMSERLCADCVEQTYLPPNFSQRTTSSDARTANTEITQPPPQITHRANQTEAVQQAKWIASDDHSDTFRLPSGQQITVSTTREGEIINVANEQIDVRSALESLAGGNIPCTGTTAQDCLSKIDQLLQQADEIKRTTAAGPGISARSVNNGPACSLPAGRSCTELERDYEMAVLSQCVYHSGPCSSDWQPVSPASMLEWFKSLILNSGNRFYR